MAERRRPIAEINVVPYIDVMLVLLVVFMVTAPLLTQGIEVTLPQEPSELLDRADDAPIIVSVRQDGSIFLNIGSPNLEDEGSRVTRALLKERAAQVFAVRADAPVFVRADAELVYGTVIDLMTVLQEAGAQSVGLVTEPPET